MRCGGRDVVPKAHGVVFRRLSSYKHLIFLPLTIFAWYHFSPPCVGGSYADQVGRGRPTGAVAMLDWETRGLGIKRALNHRDAELGHAFLPNRTGMGDIGSAGTMEQIRAYSEWARQPWVHTVCEIGFSIGTSAIVYLESNPNLRVVAFDTMSMPGNAGDKALDFLQKRYGRHRLVLVRGESQRTLLEQLHTYGGLCDIISVDGLHDARAYDDFVNFQPLANPHRHVLLADDCVPRTVYARVSAEHPNVCWSGDVWESWRRLVDDKGVVREMATYVQGGEAVPILESFSSCLKGWCEGEYILDSSE